MAKKPTVFSLEDVKSEELTSIYDNFLLASDYAIAKGLRFADNPYVKRGKLLLLKEARLGIVTEGEAIVEIDLTEYHVTKGMIILLPHDTVLNILFASEDYSLNGTILLPTISVLEPVVLNADADEYQDTMRIYETLFEFTRNNSDRKGVIEHLQRAIVDNIFSIKASMTPQQLPFSKASRCEEIFRNFKILVSRNARTERKVTFYAERLCISPHYLMSVIQSISGQSVMMWVEHAAMLQAKVMLSATDKSLQQISADMSFPSSTAFCRWFKRIEGMTPGEYIDSVRNSDI